MPLPGLLWASFRAPVSPPRISPGRTKFSVCRDVFRSLHTGHGAAYLLGLLAMIKCSICSYQCDNWYISNWRFDCHINFYQGRFTSELAQVASCVAPVPHTTGCSTPFGETSFATGSCQIAGCFLGTCLTCSTGNAKKLLWRQERIVLLPTQVVPACAKKWRQRGSVTPHTSAHPCGRGNSATSDA